MADEEPILPEGLSRFEYDRLTQQYSFAQNSFRRETFEDRPYFARIAAQLAKQPGVREQLEEDGRPVAFFSGDHRLLMMTSPTNFPVGNLVISRRMLEQFDDNELLAFTAHEMGHWKRVISQGAISLAGRNSYADEALGAAAAAATAATAAAGFKVKDALDQRGKKDPEHSPSRRRFLKRAAATALGAAAVGTGVKLAADATDFAPKQARSYIEFEADKDGVLLLAGAFRADDPALSVQQAFDKSKAAMVSALRKVEQEDVRLRGMIGKSIPDVGERIRRVEAMEYSEKGRGR